MEVKGPWSLGVRRLMVWCLGQGGGGGRERRRKGHALRRTLNKSTLRIIIAPYKRGAKC